MAVTYPVVMRSAMVGLLFALLSRSDTFRPPQEQSQAPQSQADQFFSGNVTALRDGSITVTRTVLGTESTTKTFVITPETRIEGKPRLNSRVTVRFVTSDDGDRAVHILVRPSGKK